MSERIYLADGSSWPRPALESDPDYGIGHKLRYTPLDKITRENLVEAAGIIDAYGYLMVEATGRQVAYARRGVREHIGWRR